MKEEVKEILSLIRHKRWQALLYRPTDNGLLQFLRYQVAGACAFVSDFFTVFVTKELGLHYLWAGAAGFVVGVLVNYYLSTHLAFAGKQARVSHKVEFAVFLIISLIGLGLTEGLMWVFTDGLGLHYLLSKIVSAALVFLWNFFAKKYLYRS